MGIIQNSSQILPMNPRRNITLSLLSKQKLIARQLSLFPSSTSSFQTSSINMSTLHSSTTLGEVKPRSQPKIKRGRSMEVQRKKAPVCPLNFIKKTIEQTTNKNSPLRRKKKSKGPHKTEFSRTTLGATQVTISPLSSQQLHSEDGRCRLQEENKMLRETIARQLEHIRSLESLVADL